MLLVPSIFRRRRQQLNSDTSRLSKRENEALEQSCHLENTLERESLQSLRSLSAHEVEGLQGLLRFLEDSTKRKGF